MKNIKSTQSGVKIAFTRSLFGKLLFFMLLIGIIPLNISSVFSYIQGRNALNQSLYETQDILENDQTAYLLNWVHERSQDIETLASLSRITAMNSVDGDIAIKQYFKLWGIYESMFVAGTDGLTIASTDKQINVSERAYFKEAMAGKSYMSEPLVSKGTGHIIIMFSAPVVSNGAIVGIVAGAVPLEIVAKMLANNQSGATSESYLVNQQGYFVSAPRFADEMKAAGMFKLRPEMEVQLQTTAGKEIQAGKSGSGSYINYLGKDVIGQYSWIPELKMGLISEKQTSEANTLVTQLANFSMVLTLISIVFVAVVAFGVARSMTAPVKLIANSASRLALGDIEQNLEYKSKDEYGVLADAFRQMIAYQKEMAGFALAISKGDLTPFIYPKSDKDEFGNTFKRMIISLRKSIGRVGESAVALNEASAQLASSASQAGDATTQIANTVQQVALGINHETESITRTAQSVEQMSRAIDGVARGAQDQTASVTRAAEITSGISKTIEQVAGNAQSVTRDSAEAAEAARLGARTVAETVKGMERIKIKVSLSGQAVTEMGTRSDQIGTIVETIEDIASQTNLLALNAAIEAARAGEHGKGFAVVADEVRKLAERSSLATKEIGGLIKGIQKTVAEAVRAMDEGGKEVENGVRLANESGEALAAILKAAEEVYRQAEQAGQGTATMSAASNQLVAAVDGVSAVVEENTAATEEMAAGTTEVTQDIKNIAAVSEENSAAIEEVSAAAEEMSTQVDEVKVSAQKLADMSRSLQEVVSQFKLD
jgi:methyl-accepting chemotaxis protein